MVDAGRHVEIYSAFHDCQLAKEQTMCRKNIPFRSQQVALNRHRDDDEPKQPYRARDSNLRSGFHACGCPQTESPGTRPRLSDTTSSGRISGDRHRGPNHLPGNASVHYSAPSGAPSMYNPGVRQHRCHRPSHDGDIGCYIGSNRVSTHSPAARPRPHSAGLEAQCRHQCMCGPVPAACMRLPPRHPGKANRSKQLFELSRSCSFHPWRSALVCSTVRAAI